MYPALRVVAAIAIAGWVIFHAGLGMIWDALLHVHWMWLAIGFAFMLAESFFKSVNWQWVLGCILHRHVRWGPIARSFLIGCFLGTAVPSTAGTDALRVFYSHSYFGGPIAGHAAAVVVVNIFNLVTGSAIALLMVLWLESRGEMPLAMHFLPVVFAGVVCVFPGLYFALKWRRDALVVGLRRLRRRRWFKVRHSLRRFIDSMLIFDKSGSSPLRFLAISAIAVLMQTGVWISLGYGLDVELPWAVWLLMVPANAVIALLPLSIAGFGFNQAAHVVILAAFGAAPSSALVISAMLTLYMLAINIGIGGWVFLMVGKPGREYVGSRDGATGA